MSKIRLNGTSSGYTELAPPATAGSNTITLPSGNGSANQFLKNGSTAGTLGWSSMSESGGNLSVSGNITALNGVATLDSSNQYKVLEFAHSGTRRGYVSYDNTNNWLYLNAENAGSALLLGTANTERARITSAGALFMGQTTADYPTSANIAGVAIQPAGTASFSRDAETALELNRKTNDGNLALFRQDGTIEGSISVSGTTVSYNGAHLSRWSQIPGIDPHDKDARPEILRGTVMSNLDEMCDWIDPDSGEAQANEQLNKTKISDVEGDKNVAGVFQSWDDDDDTWVNDFYLAMTGDFVIRIAEGVTVERGDLLISAGDGTAKPQDDDLIRSSTVAKVTSTTVSHVHPDGSYCIPCVLMAC